MAVSDTLSSFQSNFQSNFEPKGFIFFLAVYILLAAIGRIALPEPVRTRKTKNQKKEWALYYG